MDPRLAPILGSSREFTARLSIEDQDGRVVPVGYPAGEPAEIMEALCAPGVRTVGILKPRQIWATSTNCAHSFWKTYTTRLALRTLIAAHTDDATDAIFSKIRLFHERMPAPLKRPLRRSNRKEHIYASTGAALRCVTAGGRGQGRGWTYQRLVAEELAFWPRARNAWASLTSTMHDGPNRQTVIISTPNGPGDLYHEKILSLQQAQASGDPSVRFLFFRWSDHATYRATAPGDWDPSQEEWTLAETHGLDIEQLYWRHRKIHGVEGIGIDRFRREFPLTVEDGFLVLHGSWFDVDFLNDLIGVRLLEHKAKQGRSLRVYRKPLASMRYVIGADPAWCNGGNNAVAQVLSEAGEQVAVFSMNQGGEDLFAENLADLSMHYNGARVCCEANKGGAGANVNKRLRQLGVPLYYYIPDGQKKAKLWTTGSGNKEMAYAHARQMVNGDAVDLYDVQTIRELMHIREEDGTIEGRDGSGDDHADALVLALENLKSLPTSAIVRPRHTRRRYSVQRENPFSVTRGIR